MSDFLNLARGLDRAMQSLRTHRAVLALDSVGRIVAINEFYRRLTGFSRDALIGRPMGIPKTGISGLVDLVGLVGKSL